MVKRSCDPASPIHKLTDDGMGHRPRRQTAAMNAMEEFAQMKSVCDHPKLLGSHGSFVDPQYPELATPELAPIFSVQKIRSVNQEIRVPSTLYWSEPSPYFAQDTEPWHLKTNKVFWRGGNSGGRVDRFNWRHFHRHLLVAGLNSTLIEGTPSETCPSWALSEEICKLPPQQRHRLADFARQNMDVGFYAFGCVDKNFTRSTESGCDYLDQNFRPLPTASLQNVQGHKYLLDVDGNGYSGESLCSGLFDPDIFLLSPITPLPTRLMVMKPAFDLFSSQIRCPSRQRYMKNGTIHGLFHGNISCLLTTHLQVFGTFPRIFWGDVLRRPSTDT